MCGSGASWENIRQRQSAATLIILVLHWSLCWINPCGRAAAVHALQEQIKFPRARPSESLHLGAFVAVHQASLRSLCTVALPIISSLKMAATRTALLHDKFPYRLTMDLIVLPPETLRDSKPSPFVVIQDAQHTRLLRVEVVLRDQLQYRFGQNDMPVKKSSASQSVAIGHAQGGSPVELMQSRGLVLVTHRYSHWSS